MKTLVLGILCALALAACSEKPQELAGGKIKGSAPDWQGPATPFTSPGWKVGDEPSWSEHMKVRAQQGQNEFTRIGG
jgi:hypothetical protein